jgi:hypothetical protein
LFPEVPGKEALPGTKVGYEPFLAVVQQVWPLPQQDREFVGAVPQQALASLQQADPSLQHFWAAEQQPLSRSQQVIPLVQHASLLVAAQQARSLAQQACFFWQQFGGAPSVMVTAAG